MQRENIDKYKKYMESLMDFMNKNIKLKPYPKIKLNTQIQKDDVFGRTGYYEPESKTIVVFVAQRFFKDTMRSFAHELIHHYQNLEGRLKSDDYSGQEIINDDKLMKLEEEAYLKGNILFRSWTENIQKKIESGQTEHIKKRIKLTENQIIEIMAIESN